MGYGIAANHVRPIKLTGHEPIPSATVVANTGRARVYRGNRYWALVEAGGLAIYLPQFLRRATLTVVRQRHSASGQDPTTAAEC